MEEITDDVELTELKPGVLVADTPLLGGPKPLHRRSAILTALLASLIIFTQQAIPILVEDVEWRTAIVSAVTTLATGLGVVANTKSNPG